MLSICLSVVWQSVLISKLLECESQSAPSPVLICLVCLLQGQQVPIDRDTSHWPLAPAQEHKYDALAAFDAGQLQEAQHAFDLSVWSDLKGDRGGWPYYTIVGVNQIVS